MTITIGNLLAQGEQQLVHSDSARLDAEILLAKVLGVSRAYFFAHPEQTVEATRASRFADLIADRARGVPIAYLTGHREFWSLRFSVNQHTLIPRPETEHLVEATLSLIETHHLRRIADLGTGTGAIALAIKHERPDCVVVATDISPGALDVAQDNAARLGIDDVEFRLGDWCAALGDEHFDLIVSNPPYVAEDDPYLGQGDLRFEPKHALRAGPDGLSAIRKIIAGAKRHLAPNGWLTLEHGFEQGSLVRQALRDGGFKSVETIRDHGGNERVTIGQI
jgi:release factor glutamine methyltransferase